MKLFTKIALGIAGFFFSIAAICLVVAVSMGVTASDVQTMFKEGKFSFGPEDGLYIRLWDDNDIDISFGDDEDDGDLSEHHEDSHHYVDGYRQHEITHACTNLYIKLGAGKFDMYYGDVSCVQIRQKDVPEFEITSSDVEQELRIEGGLDVVDNSDAELIIILPQNVKLESVYLEVGASVANVSDIITDEFSFEVGAGQANMSNLSVHDFDLEVGAGQAIVKNLSVNKLNVEAGMGEVDVEIDGVEADYNYDVECGIGEVTVGNRSFGGMGAEQSITNLNATKEMNIECGIGKVAVKFTE